MSDLFAPIKEYREVFGGTCHACGNEHSEAAYRLLECEKCAREIVPLTLLEPDTTELAFC